MLAIRVDTGRAGSHGSGLQDIAAIQCNSTVGDIPGNSRRILSAWRTASRMGARLVVTPEMALPGYPPRDLLHHRHFIADLEAALHAMAEHIVDGPPLLVGTARPVGTHLHNSAVLIQDGRIQASIAKQLLPSYSVFHEPRWFQAGAPSSPIVVDGVPMGVLICEDLWDETYDIHPGQLLVEHGAQMLICMSASPYRLGVLDKRLHHAARQKVPVIFVNLVGAQDELIFDGRSFMTDADGRVVHQMAAFREDMTWLQRRDSSNELYDALVLGLRDFVRKNGLPGVVLGLSGGVDSALAACLARDALGSDKVTALALPTEFNAPESEQASAELARRLGIRYEVVSVQPLLNTARTVLPIESEHGAWENVQARLRCLILMAWVNRYGGVLLNTSNKTELSLGYGTLYGDLAGTISPLGDLTKLQVYDLARTRAEIPPWIIERAPSAELRPGQVDPFDYPAVSPRADAAVHGQTNEYLARVLAHEHKRMHCGIVLKVSEAAFGSGRMYPITQQWILE